MPGLEGKVSKSTGLKWFEAKTLVQRTLDEYNLEGADDDLIHDNVVANWNNMTEQEKDSIRSTKKISDESSSQGSQEDAGDAALGHDPKHPSKSPLMMFCLF